VRENVLQIKDLCAGYDKVEVVHNVSLDIKKGEVFGLVGLNGVGKTTLIKTVLGLREKFSGDIDLISKETVSYLPERFDPPWFLSGYEFLQFSLKLYGKTISKERAIKEVLRVSLNPDFLNKRVNTYSKGMRQKLGLLATFLTEAPLLILDEPMSGLDPKARQEVKTIIKSTKEAGRSVFMCSHILSDIEELCDSVAVFDEGKVVFEGSPKDMLKHGKGDNLEKSFLSMIS